MTTGYILAAIRFEENDMVRHFGEKYIEYKRSAPMLIPFTKRARKVEKESMAEGVGES